MNENAKQPEAAAGFCRQCGKALTPETRRDVRGVYYCEDCLATATLGGQATAAGGANPVVAALLGLIPGVGAIYNGEYMKALTFIFIFGGTISLMDSGAARGIEPLLGLFMAGFYFYMPIEAYQTAKRRASGLAPASSGWEMPGAKGGKATPIGPLVLIVVGVLILLNNFLPYHFHLFRFWPVALIACGGWMLWKRTIGAPPA
jgi:hypothetical protein